MKNASGKKSVADQLKLAELAVFVPSSIRVFEEFEIDYYCRGDRTLEKACLDAGIDVNLIEGKINNNDGSEEYVNYYDWNIDRVVDHIRNKFHSVERTLLPLMKIKISKVVSICPAVPSYMNEEAKQFDLLLEDLHVHSKKEEEELFPAILGISLHKASSKNYSTIYSMPDLETDHLNTGTRLNYIKAISGNFSSKRALCNDFAELMEELKEFEKMFHLHLHLENNILFPKVREVLLELSLTKPV